MPDPQIYDQLAALLRYPSEDCREDIERCRVVLAAQDPEAAERIGRFAQAVHGLSHEQRQELFVQTFDLNPVCVLEVGWHLYGDTYDRGTFLVTMREHLRRFELKEDSELPDHLTHVLAVLGQMEQDEANQFAAKSVLPALEKMLAGLEGKSSPYEEVLRALRRVASCRHARGLEEVRHE